MTRRGARREPVEVEQGDMLTEPVKRGGEVVQFSPEAMMQLAIRQGGEGKLADVAEVIERLTRLKMEMQATEDRKALFSAIAKAKREFPRFEKTRTYDILNAAGAKVRTGEYAPLEDMLAGATPVLESNDLFVTFDQQTASPGRVRSVCVVTHANGQTHSAGFDVTTESRAGMSPQQKESSATSFAMRCAFMLLFGIVPSLPESVAQEFDETPVNDEQAATLYALAEEVKADVARFLSYFGAAKLAELPARRYAEAVAMLEQKRKRGAP